MRFLSFSLIAVAVLAFSAGSRAENVRIDGFTSFQYETVKVGNASGTVPAGQLTGFLNGTSFKTYCVDLAQWNYAGTTYTDYSLVSGITAFGAARSNELDHLLSYLSTRYDTSKSLDSAVAQSAVWEVIYETGTGYDLTRGNFVAASSDALTRTAFASFDWAAVATTAITLHADQLYSPTAQDFVRVTAVPEPSTYALMFGGLGALGFVARRRRQAV